MRGLKNLIRNVSPLSLFLIETKIIFSRMRKIGHAFLCDELVSIEACNSRGGLAGLWSSVLDWKVIYKL